jgi:methylated-DNA-[protein]-cysteine S-methyltransferase
MFERVILQHWTPIGWLTLKGNHAGLTAIEFGKTAANFGNSKILEKACHEIDEYFVGRRTKFDIPVSLTGTPFQKLVWASLQKIPYGAFPSYSDLAAAVGRPSAVRAVGMALNKNPIPIIIPCHRVIGRDGSLTGYAGGLDVKRKLIDLELRTNSEPKQSSFGQENLKSPAHLF